MFMKAFPLVSFSFSLCTINMHTSTYISYKQYQTLEEWKEFIFIKDLLYDTYNTSMCMYILINRVLGFCDNYDHPLLMQIILIRTLNGPLDRALFILSKTHDLFFLVGISSEYDDFKAQ